MRVFVKFGVIVTVLVIAPILISWIFDTEENNSVKVQVKTTRKPPVSQQIDINQPTKSSSTVSEFSKLTGTTEQAQPLSTAKSNESVNNQNNKPSEFNNLNISVTTSSTAENAIYNKTSEHEESHTSEKFDFNTILPALVSNENSEEIDDSQIFYTSTLGLISSSKLSQENITITTQASKPEKEITTTAVETCFYNNNSNYFICTIKGRFQNDNDKTCGSYYLCSQLRSGLFLKTKYSCPANSCFNPSKQLCDIEYICPCLQTTASTTSTTEQRTTTPERTSTSTEVVTTEKTTTDEVTTEKVTIEDETTQATTIKPTAETTSSSSEESTNTTTETSSTKPSEESTMTSNGQTVSTTEITTTTIDTCVYNNDPNYLTCTIKGRFRNDNDATCRSYYLCSQLRSGLFLKTKYSCPANYCFNPSKQLCDIEYICPCLQTTASTTSTTKQRTTTPERTSTSTEVVTTEKITTDEVTTKKVTIEDETTQTTSSSSKESTKARTETSSTKPSEESTMTSNGQTFSTTEITTTTINTCVYNNDPNYLTCTIKGRFRNDNDATCRSYYLCSQLRSGLFLKTKYSCPANYCFNPSKQLCDIEYICPCLQTTASTTSTTKQRTTTPERTSTSTEVVTTEKITTDEVTTEKVTIEDETTQTTSSSSEESTNARTETSSTKPSEESTMTSNGQTFSTTEITTTIIETCFYNNDPNYLTCKIKGRFRNDNDATCRSYYLCSQLRSGLFLKTKYSCPANYCFNPSKQLCDIEYICPCLQTTASTTSTTEQRTTTPESTSTSTEVVTTEKTTMDEVTTEKVTIEDETTQATTIKPTTETTSSSSEESTNVTTETSSKKPSQGSTMTSNGRTVSTTEITTTTVETCVYNSDPNYLTCTIKGRFRNDNDATCRSYYLCSQLRSGLFLKTKYSCPANYCFNPSKQLCDIEYICPCLQTTASTTSTTKQRTTTPERTSTSTEVVTTEKITTDEVTTKKVTIEDETTQTTSSSSKESTKARTETSSTKPSEESTMTSNGQTFSTTEITTTTIDTCVYNNDPNYLTCTIKGRFRNDNDATCRSYYLCSQLRSGLFLKTKYSCPANYCFNPSKQLCDIEYICPCLQTTASTTSTTEQRTTTPERTSTSTEVVTTEKTTMDEVTTEKVTIEDETTQATTIKPTTETTSSSSEESTNVTTETSSKKPSQGSIMTSNGRTVSTTEITTTTVETCVYNSDPNYLTCTIKGRFRNDNDATCRSYYLCSQLRSGLFLKTKYSCPANSCFNPSKQLCDIEYSCTC